MVRTPYKRGMGGAMPLPSFLFSGGNFHDGICHGGENGEMPLAISSAIIIALAYKVILESNLSLSWEKSLFI